MARYDIIGDVHGCATKLVALLNELGYRKDQSGVYRHPERTAVFVGDLIDRGEEQLEVLKLVKAMVDGGSARITMGNHEFNAIAWATTDPATGKPLRKHTDHNREQHKAFLELTPEDQAYYIAWFKTLPLWLDDLDGIRVVHACWHDDSMKTVREVTGGNRLLTDEHIVRAAKEGCDLYEAVEVLLKGPEIPLEDHEMPSYWDHEANKERKKARIRWWDDSAATLPELAELAGVKLKNGDDYPQCERRDVNDPKYLSYVYTDTVPLFYGHYWRRWEPVHLDEWTTYTACVDFSAVRGGTLVAYRWNGEDRIVLENYVPHDPQIVAQRPSDLPV